MPKKQTTTPEQLQSPAPEERPVEKSISKAHIVTFWAGVVLALVVARALNYALPGISESLIERWVMLGFGVFMALFIWKLK